MPARHVVIRDAVPTELAEGLAGLADQVDLPDGFSDQVLQEANQSAEQPPDPSRYRDLTGLEFITIDPPGSMDLDQALFLERAGDGFTVWYAIADVAAWLRPGGAIDAEARRRGQTFYAPTTRTPLHPPQLSENAASLLADGRARPALVWCIELDNQGHQVSATVERAMVRSRARRSYAEVQAELDAGQASETVRLLQEVGLKRQRIEAERGGISLNIPEQEIHVEGKVWSLEFRQNLPVEGWNAQISLLTGMAAAGLMLGAGVGILRTLPPARQHDVERLRHIAKGLQIRWPGSVNYPDFVRSLDSAEPRHQAMLNACTLLFRGAGYTVLDGTQSGEELVHAALAANYAHTTAPLRRLVDRYVGEICVSLCAGQPVPEWVLEVQADLPQIMSESDRAAKRYERGVVDLVEALVLSQRRGEHFEATVIELFDDDQGVVVLRDPAVEARVSGRGLELGDEVVVQVAEVDLGTGRVELALT